MLEQAQVFVKTLVDNADEGFRLVGLFIGEHRAFYNVSQQIRLFLHKGGDFAPAQPLYMKLCPFFRVVYHLFDAGNDAYPVQVIPYWLSILHMHLGD